MLISKNYKYCIGVIFCFSILLGILMCALANVHKYVCMYVGIHTRICLLTSFSASGVLGIVKHREGGSNMELVFVKALHSIGKFMECSSEFPTISSTSPNGR